jgi:hypothetical protein
MTQLHQFIVGNEVTLNYGLVFPILTFVADIWDWESTEYDESCLVWWEVSWPRKHSPPFGNLWPLGHARQIERRRPLPACCGFIVT